MPQMNKQNDLGPQIDAARERKSARSGGYTLYRLAKDAGVDYSQLHRIVRGKSMPSRVTLIKICRALGCTEQEAADLFSFTEYRTPAADELDEASLAMTA